MKTVYINDRGERGLSGVAFGSRIKAESHLDDCQREHPGETWEVRTFVDLDDVLTLIRELSENEFVVSTKNSFQYVHDTIQEAASDG